MIVEILRGYEHPETKVTRENKPFYIQKAYIHKGGAFPEEIELTVESPAHAYPVGQYNLDPSCFRANKYRKLEINPYGIKLMPVKASETIKKVS